MQILEEKNSFWDKKGYFYTSFIFCDGPCFVVKLIKVKLCLFCVCVDISYASC